MQNFIELLKDHTLILSAVSTLQDITGRAEPAPGAAFDALRKLSRLLDAHLRAEADFIRLDGEHSHQEFAVLAESHGKPFEDLVAEWAIYLREWSEENMAQDWATFARETQRIMTWLTAQVEAENRSLYPAALKYGLIRLLPEKMRSAA